MPVMQKSISRESTAGKLATIFPNVNENVILFAEMIKPRKTIV